MLISIAGSQGSGKSTVLSELDKEGYNVVERKTARSILDEWNVTLDTVNQDPELKMAFQMELVNRKWRDEMEYVYADEVFFTERTFADLFTYALIAFGQYNKYDAWIEQYYTSCKEACSNYGYVFYLASCFSDNIEHDGVRSTNQYYSRMVDSVMTEFTCDMIPQDKLAIVTASGVGQRVQHIKETLGL